MTTVLVLLAAMMVALGINADTYSELGLVQADPNVGLHEFIGRDPQTDTPETGTTGRVTTSTTRATTGGPGAGREVADGADMEDEIGIVNFWKQFEKFYKEVREQKTNASYMGEDHTEGARGTIEDANNPFPDTNLMDTRKTLDNEEGHRGGASVSAPSNPEAHTFTPKCFDTPTNVLQRIDVHTNKHTGQHPEAAATSLKHAKEASVHYMDETPLARPENSHGNPGKDGYGPQTSLLSKTTVYENTSPDAELPDVEVVSQNDTRLNTDEMAEASFANEREFYINQNTNETKMPFKNANSKSSPLQIPVVEIFSTIKSTDEYTEPSTHERGGIRHGDAVLEMWGVRDNAAEVSDLRDVPASDNIIWAVRDLFASNKPSSPVIVVERSEAALRQATDILHGVIDGRISPHEQALLVTYTDEVSATTCDREDLPALLGRLTASEGPRWAALRAVEAAAGRAPPGGGVLLLAGSQPSDKNLFYPVIRALSAKHLELHVVWCGPKAAGAEGSLRDLSWYSGGSFHVTETAAGHPPHLVTLAVQKGLTGSSLVEIPVDSSLRAVDVAIRGPVKTAVLYDPAGRPTDLQPMGAATLSDDDSLLEARLNTSSTAPGRWTLAVVGAGAASYDVTVRGTSPLDFAPDPETDDSSTTLDLMLRGEVEVDTVETVSALDRLGREVARLNYTRTTPLQLAVADVQLLPSAASYLRVSGADTNGVAFQRVTDLSQQGTAGTSPIELEVAPNSTLSVLPGQVAQIIYTVTNNQEVTNYIDFRCSSQHFIVSVQPQSFQLAAHQTIYVLVTVRVPQNTPLSTQDIITMTAIYGPNSGISNIAYFTVGREVSDTEKPTINYRVDSDCGSSDTSDCRLKTWRVEIIAQDKQSGLLQVTSQPKGLHLRSTFVAGTTDLVAAYYSATCCDPSIVVTAIDASNNYATQTITATPTVQLSAAATAGIVIGVLLFIIIIIIAAVVVVRRRRRQSVSFPQSTDT